MSDDWIRTAELRFVKRLATRMSAQHWPMAETYTQHILQQRWASSSGLTEWRDVLTVEEDEA